MGQSAPLFLPFLQTTKYPADILHSCFFAMLPRKEDARRHPVAVEHIRFSSVPIDADSHIAL